MANPRPVTYYAPVSPIVAGREWVAPPVLQVLADAAAAGALSCAFVQDGIAFVSSSHRDNKTKVSRYDGAAWAHIDLHDWGAVDIHQNASIIPLGDGRVLAAYCQHLGSPIYKRVSASPLALDFGAESTLLSGYNSGYPSLYRASSGRIWLFFSEYDAPGRHVRYCYSDDGGATFSSPVRLWQTTSGAVPYWGVAIDGDDVLFMTGREHGYVASAGTSSGYFARYDAAAGQWKTAGGMTYALPITIATGEVCFDASAVSQNFGFNPTPLKDGAGRYCVYTAAVSPNDTFYLCRFNGTSWDRIAMPSETSGNYNGSSPVPSATDPYTCYLIRPTTGLAQVYRYRSPDDGATWYSRPMTSFASGDPVQQIMRIDGDGARWLTHQMNRTDNATWDSVIFMGGV